MVDVALAAVDAVAVVYVMRGAFARHQPLAEARRHLSYVLRGRPPPPGLDEQIVQTAVDDYTRPASRRMMTAGLQTSYPRGTEDHAMLRPLTRKRTATPYEWSRLAADALSVGSGRPGDGPRRTPHGPAPSTRPACLSTRRRDAALTLLVRPAAGVKDVFDRCVCGAR
ncbi:hypothetical protein AB0H29_16705 [Streptomyces thermolilacinus]